MMDYNKIKGREIILKAKLSKNGGIIERMDKKAKANVFRITDIALEDSINKFLEAGGKIKRY